MTLQTQTLRLLNRYKVLVIDQNNQANVFDVHDHTALSAAQQCVPHAELINKVFVFIHRDLSPENTWLPAGSFTPVAFRKTQY